MGGSGTAGPKSDRFAVGQRRRDAVVGVPDPDGDDAGVLAIEEDARPEVGRLDGGRAYLRRRSVLDLEELQVLAVRPGQQFAEHALTRGRRGPADERVGLPGQPELQFGQRFPVA